MLHPGRWLMNKRGLGWTVGITLFVALLIAVFILIFSGRVFTEAEETRVAVTPSAIKAQITSCKLQQPLGFQDSDGDGLPDFCDPCLGGDDKQQKDSDLVADACDRDIAKATSIIEACCGEDVTGTSEEIISKCKNKKLVSVKPFQCKA